jgi:hypothetical protein
MLEAFLKMSPVSLMKLPSGKKAKLPVLEIQVLSSEAVLSGLPNYRMSDKGILL